MDSIKVAGNVYAWMYNNDKPDQDFVLMARTKDGDIRMTIEINKEDCMELYEALKEHLGEAVKD